MGIGKFRTWKSKKVLLTFFTILIYFRTSNGYKLPINVSYRCIKNAIFTHFIVKRLVTKEEARGRMVVGGGGQPLTCK